MRNFTHTWPKSGHFFIVSLLLLLWDIGQYMYCNCFSGRDVIKFELKLLFPIMPFFYMNKKMLKQNKALVRRCSENIQQIYRKTPMPKCDLNKVSLRGCSPVNLLHIFRTPLLMNTFGRLLNIIVYLEYKK